ncbi:hypothetical protein [Tunicatimonas pelagia]|uniref:hypothetical protein n=1 Tax=Tunicatimonas pelagia TaxID=931531 RepID=UPI002666FD4E|nr:hypothetical protein [Tunicatimonas pelagia]WKN42164.1 hypothetical protein P0M28_24310 [Tunicatimonas pelagia]
MKKLAQRATYKVMVSGLLLFFTVGFGAESIAQRISADPQDSLLLVQFQQELQLRNWPQIWGFSAPVEEWVGVRLDSSSGKVKALEIVGAQINFRTDSLPSCIKTLQALDKLEDLAFVALGLKHISQEIGGFSQLTSLVLGNNQLASIPQEINQLTELRFLSVGMNRLVISPDVHNLKKLTHYNLGANYNLHTLHPSTFGLTTLTTLDIGYCGFTQLPKEIGQLTNLTNLRVSSNQSLALLPSTIGQLTSLTKLELNHCALTELPSTVGDLRNLKSLSVNQNQLTDLPARLENLDNLVQIGFSENQLTAFPPVLAEMSRLRFIAGQNNRMQGSIPERILLKRGLRMNVEGNELSGELLVKSWRVPEQLYVSRNRFTFKDMHKVFDFFEPKHPYRPTFFGFQPQKRIGTARTFKPLAGENFTLFIDNYTPLAGCEFAWYRKANQNSLSGTKVSNQQELEIPSIDPAQHSGIYYCEVTHPSFPSIKLKSNDIRVISFDQPPILTIRNQTLRQGDVLGLDFSYQDDFTPSDELKLSVPTETTHLSLVFDSQNRKYSVTSRDNQWLGTDSLTISVTDEANQTTTKKVAITVISSTNQPPVVSIPSIYMNIINDAQLPCTPGTPNCNLSYIFVSTTPLYHFVKDDLAINTTSFYKILEANQLGQINGNSKVTVRVIPFRSSVAIEAVILAKQDTTVKVTLEVTDREGLKSAQEITFIANGISPNQSPEIAEIPIQSILQGERQFSTLNLNNYVSDDYLPNELLIWEARSSLQTNLAISVSDSLAQASPIHADSAYTETIVYDVYEKTNYNRSSNVSVVYEIVEGAIYAISGTITVDGQPLSGVQLIGLPSSPIVTDNAGQYTAEVTSGWSGEVTPTLADYSFDPASITYTNVSMNLAGNNYEAIFDEVLTYTISGTVTEGVQPLSGVELQGFPSASVVTNNVGQYTAEVPIDWSGSVTPVLEGYHFTPSSSSYTEVVDDLNNQDYEASLNGIITYTISGTITVDGQPLSGVQLNGFPFSSIVTDSVGQYMAEVPSDWSSTVTPALEDYRFEPESIVYTTVAMDMAGDYSGTFNGLVTYKISGIVSAEGQPLSGVQLTGFPSSSVITDNTGQYVAEVPSGWSGEVTPVLGDYQFNPISMSYQNVTSDQINQNFNTQVVTGINPDIDQDPWQVFPNPSTNEVYFRVHHTSFTTGQIIIFSTSGDQMEVLPLKVGVEMYRLQVTGDARYAPGVYIAKLYLDKNLKATVKVIIAE